MKQQHTDDARNVQQGRHGTERSTRRLKAGAFRGWGRSLLAIAMSLSMVLSLTPVGALAQPPAEAAATGAPANATAEEPTGAAAQPDQGTATSPTDDKPAASSSGSASSSSDKASKGADGKSSDAKKADSATPKPTKAAGPTPTEGATPTPTDVPKPAASKTASAGSVTVTVEVGEDVFAEGWTLEARSVPADDVKGTISTVDPDAQVVTALDLTVRDRDGHEVGLPSGKTAKVTFSGTDAPSDDVAVYRIAESTQKVSTRVANANKQEFAADKLDPTFVVTAQVAKDEAVYPAASFSDSANGVTVNVEAPEGALPEGAKMVVTGVGSADVIDAVNDAVEGEVSEQDVHAVDITFKDAAGEEIEPAKPVNVKLTTDAIKDAEAPAVVHIDDAGSASVVADQKAGGSEMVFESKDFSVYVVVDPGQQGDNARLTVKFVNGSKTIASMQVKKADLGEQFPVVLYDPGVGELDDDQVFRGWTDNENYTVADADKGMDINKVREDVESKLTADVQEGDVVTYYAQVYTVYNVTYKAIVNDENVVLNTDPLLVVKKGDEVAYEVDMPYTPASSDQDFRGWYIDPTGNATLDGGGAVSADEPYPNETNLKIKGSITLTANAPDGFWLIFKENGKGASYTPAQFLVTEKNEKTEEPTDPQRNGYTFGGWYENAECTGNAFVFGNVLTKTTTLYAKWTPAETANYTVIIWKQNVGDAKNAADSAKTYDFAESITLSGTSGTTINTVSSTGTGNDAYASVDGTAKQYFGFHLNKYDQNVTIAPEGTTVLNVYYDRNLVTLTFRNGNTNTVVQTMTGLYGSTLESNGYEWPSSYSWTSGQYGGTQTTFLDAFIPSNGSATAQTFYRQQNSGNATIRFYKKNSSGDGYTLANTVNASSSGTFYITDKYNGYKAVQYSTNGTSWTNLGEKDSQGVYESVGYGNNLYIRFDPLLYNILYMDGVYIDGDNNPVAGYEGGAELRTVEDIPYGSSIASYAEGGTDYYEPTTDGFVFSGWYLDDSCTQPATWTTMTEGITVYAKWVQTQYRVFLHPNAYDPETGAKDPTYQFYGETSFRIDVDEAITISDMIRDDYELVGWYLDEDLNNHINFDAFSTKMITGEYNKDARSTETDKYGEEISTENKDKARPWIQHCLDLYGKWRKKLEGAEGIKVKYDANGGSNAPTDSNLYKDDTLAVAAGASTAPTGTDPEQVFSHWVLQKWDGREFVDTETTVLPGDTFKVYKSDSQVLVYKWANPEDPEDVFTVESPTPGTTPPDSTHTTIVAADYTLQLRAEYVDKGHETKTHIDWYANNGTMDKVSNNPIGYNENAEIKPANTFTYEGHTFIGWAKAATGSDAPTEVNFLWYKNGKFYSDAACTKEATYVAADEKTPYDDLYAIWAEDVTVKIVGTEKTEKYNGSEQSNSDYTVEYYVAGKKVDSLPEGVTFTQVPTSPAAKGTNVGEYTQTVTGTLTSTNSKYAVPEDAVTDGTIVLKITPAEVTLTANSGTEKYDGTEKAVTGYTPSVEGLTFTGVAASGAGTDAGTYDVTFTGVTVNETKDSTGNYVVTGTTDGTLEISKRTVTLTSATDEKVYDGQPLTNGTVTVGGDGFATGEGATYDVTGTQTQKGSSANTFTYTLNSNTKADNYEITKTEGTLTVTEFTDKVTVTITENSGEEKYDGTEKTVTGYDVSISNPLYTEADFTFSGDATVKGTDAGTYDMELKPADFANVSDNFSDVEFVIVDGTLEISPRTVTLTSATDSKVYDGQPLTNGTVTVGGD
ncbi:MAG: InlB B-repeat-containing protein, partial [Actinomycetota bacterium]|nr:InlB B-repeat-containing protein [Actinomycetota bacterium]